MLRSISEISRHKGSRRRDGVLCLSCLTRAISLPWAQEAYTEYLRSIHYISQVLLEEVETTEGTALSLAAAPGLVRFWTPKPLAGFRPGGVLSYPLGH